MIIGIMESSKNILQIGWEKINENGIILILMELWPLVGSELNGEWYYLTSNGDMVTGAQTNKQ